MGNDDAESAALNEGITDMSIGGHSDHKKSPAYPLDEPAATTVSALAALQEEHDKIFDEYTKERMELEERYDRKFGPFYKKRSEELQKGHLPLFWFTAFENCEMLRENMTNKDIAALKYLRDVTVTKVTGAEAKASPPDKKLTPGSFTLHFHFAPNPFFESEVLTKTYVMAEDDDDDLEQAIGCSIAWKPGKDLTVRIMKKKIRGGRGGGGKVITRKEPVDSFFNFFSPPKAPEKGEEIAEEDLEALEEVIAADYEMGDAIRQDVVPRAVLYFKDEVEGEEDKDEAAADHEDADDEEDDDDDEEEDDDTGDSAGGSGKDANGAPNPGLPPAAQSAEECKQQ